MLAILNSIIYLMNDLLHFLIINELMMLGYLLLLGFKGLRTIFLFFTNL